MKLLLRYYKPITIILIIGIAILGMQSDVHATGQCMAEASSQGTYLTGVVIRWMSWFRFIPAVLAGQLMSNDLAYGQIVGLDTFFYQFWTLMRTISNFALVTIIVVMIGKIIMGKSEPGQVIKEYGFKILVSGVLINMSWLIMGILVDVSTIMVTGVGQISNTYMNKVLLENAANQEGAPDRNKKTLNELALGIPNKIRIDECGCLQSENTEQRTSRDQITDNHNEIAGPLVFLGAGVMKLQAYSLNVGCGTTTEGELGKLTVKTILLLTMMVMFVIPLVILAAVNLFRLIYIRGWVIFSPLIVLYNLFEKEVDEVMPSSGGLKNAISLGNIVAGLVQPVATVTALTFGMMLITGIYSALDFTATKTEENTVGTVMGITNKLDGSKMDFGSDDIHLGSITLTDQLINDPTQTLGGGFGYLLVGFVTCMVMWMMVKLSFSISSKTFTGMGGFEAGAMMDKANNYFMKTVKLPGGASLGEAASMMDFTSNKNRILKTINDRSRDYTDASNKKVRDQTRKSAFGKALGLDDEGDLDAKNTYDFSDPINDDKLKTWNTETKRLYTEANAIVGDKENDYKGVPINRGTEAYKKVSKWQQGISKYIDKSFDSKQGYEKESNFENIYAKTSYSARLFEYLKKGNELKIEGGKIDDNIIAALEKLPSYQFSTMTVNK